MRPAAGPTRGMLALVILAVLVGLVSLPVLAADPSGTPADPSGMPTASPSGTPAPLVTAAASAQPEATKAPKPSKAPRESRPKKVPEAPVTITGTIESRTSDGEQTVYTIVVDGKTLTLDAGPSWFFKDEHPLRALVGTQVTITGTQRAGETEVDVETVDGKRIRQPGRPPWAGGWKQVGEDHPGWSEEKWDRWQAKLKARLERFGTDCFPPGRCKDKPGKDKASGSPAP